MARLLVNESKILLIRERPGPVPDHLELQRLPFGRLPRHASDALQDAEGLTERQDASVLEQRLEGEGQHRVADVHRNWHAMEAMQRRTRAASLGSVLHVVMDQEGVVIEFQDGSRRQHGAKVGAKRPAYGNAES